MEKTELAINDLVYFPMMLLTHPPKRKCGKVTREILSSKQALKEIAPIPITEDMLKTNGWEKRLSLVDNKEYYMHKKCSVLTLQYCNNMLYVIAQFSICTVIEFVHNFQHVLRSFGFNSLADNFKIIE